MMRKFCHKMRTKTNLMPFQISWKIQLLTIFFLIKQVKYETNFAQLNQNALWYIYDLTDRTGAARVLYKINESMHFQVISEVVFFCFQFYTRTKPKYQNTPSNHISSKQNFLQLQQLDRNWIWRFYCWKPNLLSVILVFINIPDHFRAAWL